MKSALLVSAAILLAGGMVAAAILYVHVESRPEVIETRSAQEAWEYADAGWHCAIPVGDDPDLVVTDEGLKPSAASGLEPFARLENESDELLWASAPRPARCTEP
jgi:hypothetical protein